MIRFGTLRDWIAMAIIFIATPLAVFGGTNIACIGQGLSSECALTAVWISPMLLIIAGLVAGMITHGWTGLFVVGVGQIGGQVVIVALAYFVGRPVPIDYFSAILATVWFGAPIAIGYGIARVASRLAGRRSAPKGDTPA